MKSVRLFAAAGCLTLGVMGAGVAHAAPGQSASGQGTLDDGARTFSFSARQAADGTVKGQAQLVNRNFSGTPDNPAPYRLHIDISCMNRVGDTVFFGGTVKSTNDPNLNDAVFFSVEDHGEPGAGNDLISRAHFWDDDPETTGDPSACMFNQEGDFPLELIERGNVQVSS